MTLYEMCVEFTLQSPTNSSGICEPQTWRIEGRKLRMTLLVALRSARRLADLSTSILRQGWVGVGINCLCVEGMCVCVCVCVRALLSCVLVLHAFPLLDCAVLLTTLTFAATHPAHYALCYLPNLICIVLLTMVCVVLRIVVPLLTPLTLHRATHHRPANHPRSQLHCAIDQLLRAVAWWRGCVVCA